MPPVEENDVEQPEDLRDTISRAFDEQAEKDAPAAAETPKAVEATTDAPADKAASDERPRGPDGKFIAKADDAAEGDDATEAVVEEPAEEAAEEPAETKPAPAEVPQHWSQADKDMVGSLPAEHRGKVVERIKAIEAGFTPKLQRAALLEKEWAPAAEIFAPYVHALRSQGQTPSDVVKAWAAIELDLGQGLTDANAGRPNQKAAARIATLISHYRVDPALVAEYLTNPDSARMPLINGGTSGAEIPPAVMREIEGLKERERQREEASAMGV